MNFSRISFLISKTDVCLIQRLYVYVTKYYFYSCERLPVILEFTKNGDHKEGEN